MSSSTRPARTRDGELGPRISGRASGAPPPAVGRPSLRHAVHSGEPMDRRQERLPPLHIARRSERSSTDRPEVGLDRTARVRRGRDGGNPRLSGRRDRLGSCVGREVVRDPVAPTPPFGYPFRAAGRSPSLFRRSRSTRDDPRLDSGSRHRPPSTGAPRAPPEGAVTSSGSADRAPCRPGKVADRPSPRSLRYHRLQGGAVGT